MPAYFPELSPAFGVVLESLRGQPVAVIGHARPDGDCIGSQIAVARVLQQAYGCEVICVNGDTVPRRLEFLVPGMSFYKADAVPAGREWRAIFLDCADIERPGKKVRERFPTPVLSVDHHMSNGGFAAHNCIDTSAAATAELLAGFFLDLGLPVDAQTAQGLYVGIMTDTGQFRFASTTQRAFHLAAELVARGASPAEAGFHLFERETPGKLALLQRFLASFRFECGGRVCVGTLPLGVFEETGAHIEDTEGLVDYARAIEGVEVGVLIEARPEGVKGSLRSKDPALRVDRIAGQFNGGGHACAAGLNYHKPLDVFYPELIAALEKRFAELA